MKNLTKNAPSEVGYCDLLSFFVGGCINVNDEYVAVIIEVNEDSVKLSSKEFNGWALKSELQAFPS